MKRKAFLFVILVLFFAGMIFGIVYLSNPDIFSGDNTGNENYVSTKLVEYPVFSGEVVHTYETKGQVISGMAEIYVEEIVLEGVTDNNLTIYKSKGEEISAGERLYEFKKKEVTADYEGKLLDVSYESVSEGYVNATITILNYDKLYIVTDIDADKYEKINYATQVNITCDKGEYSAGIKNIGYEIEENKVPVEIYLPTKMLPGTQVSISFVLEVQEAGTYIPKDALYQDGDVSYVYVKNGNDKVYTEVSTGQEFSVEEDGDTFEYVEILSGVSEGDILVVETISNSNELILEKLENE